MMWRWRRYARSGRYWGIGSARGHFRRAPWSGDFRHPKLAERKKRASEVTKYLSTYTRVEIIAKLRKKNVTASTGIKLVVWSICVSGFDVNRFLLRFVLIPKWIRFPVNSLIPDGATPTQQNTHSHTPYLEMDDFRHCFFSRHFSAPEICQGSTQG